MMFKLEDHINENPLEKINQIKGENIYNFKETINYSNKYCRFSSQSMQYHFIQVFL